MSKKSFKGFYRFSDPEQLNEFCSKRNLKEQFNIVQKVQDDGVEHEFMISFYKFGEKLAARAEVFVDAFIAFEMHSNLFEELSKFNHITPDEMEEILISLGYRNLTKEEGNNNE